MGSAPRVSVIVAIRDAAQSLPRLFERLHAQTVGRDDVEIVVADNASRDGGAEVARRAGAKVVEEPTPGRARARNRAVAGSRGELLAFTDADCAPRPDWLEQLLPGLEEAEMAGGRVLITTLEPPSAIELFESLWRFLQREAVLERGWSATANMAMRREAFDAVGGFDPSMRRIGEDVDLCLRAGAAGQRIVWRPEAVVEHDAERELLPVLRRAFNYAVSDDVLHRRHGLPPARTWRHPGPLVRGDWALRRFGLDPDRIPEPERARVLRVARLEYAARLAASIWSAWENRGEPPSPQGPPV
jgi:cellulose synthase/poly-beta-1,6-N-acetylglucosamine synthase-like glycosyltransferase